VKSIRIKAYLRASTASSTAATSTAASTSTGALPHSVEVHASVRQSPPRLLRLRRRRRLPPSTKPSRATFPSPFPARLRLLRVLLVLAIIYILNIILCNLSFIENTMNDTRKVFEYTAI